MAQQDVSKPLGPDVLRSSSQERSSGDRGHGYVAEVIGPSWRPSSSWPPWAAEPLEGQVGVATFYLAPLDPAAIEKDPDVAITRVFQGPYGGPLILREGELVRVVLNYTLGLAIWLLPLLGAETAPSRPPVTAYSPSHPLPFFDERTFAAAEATTAVTPVEPMPDARGLLLPHDWVGSAFITTSLRDLAASRKVTRVILVGPNHTNAGGAAVLTSDLPWETPFGQAEADREAVTALAAGGLARLEPEVLTYEHSVAGIIPAVRRYLPNAKVVPLVLRGGLSAEDVERLAAALTPLVDDGTVVVAAVDFSHGLPASAARERDGETLALLRASNWAPLLRWGNEHLDSPASVAVLIETMGRLGATRFELRGNSNSGEVSGMLALAATSYIVGYFH